MKAKENLITKRLMSLTMVLLLVLTTVLLPIQAEAAEAPKVVANFILKKGEKWNLQVYDAADNAKITYKTSKKAVATVSKKGVVTAKKVGKATITTTIKQGGKTYTAKTKIQVKKKLSTHDQVYRLHGEFGLAYTYCFELAELNGWLENEDAVTWLKACYDIVELANDMAENKSKYTEADRKAAIDGIIELTEQMEEMLEVFVEPNPDMEG